jgi:hypothetical protein
VRHGNVIYACCVYIHIYMCVCPRVYSHIIWIHMDVCTCVHLIIFMCVCDLTIY